MVWSPFVLIICWALLVPSAFGLSVNFHGPRGVIQRSTQQLVSRGPAGGLALNNSGDVGYYAGIVLGNQTYQVLLDTGSADLWVAGSVTDSEDTGFTASINYAVNSVEGAVKTTRLVFANHMVEDQAFLEVPVSDQNPEGTGILGLGPSSGSFIEKAYSSGGTTVLDSIFNQNSSTPNFFTVLLGRAKDPSTYFIGSVTVGEVVKGYETILDEPKLAITQVPSSMADDQHLQILLDPDGIIGPDGLPIPMTSSVQQTKDKKQLTAVLDSGFTLPQLPRSVVDAIYSRFENALFRDVSGVGETWILPCTQEVNVTFTFAGKPYPIHPLDMTMELETIGLPQMTLGDGERACIGTFQPFTYSRGKSPNYDMVLGMAFMRNVYSLFNYGDFAQNSTDRDDSYVQLLSITNLTEAHHDFVKVRLGGNDTTSRPLKPVAAAKTSHRLSALYYVIGAVGVVAAFVAAGAVYFLWRSRRWRNKAPEKA